MDRHPACAGFSRGKGNLVTHTSFIHATVAISHRTPDKSQNITTNKTQGTAEEQSNTWDLMRRTTRRHYYHACIGIESLANTTTTPTGPHEIQCVQGGNARSIFRGTGTRYRAKLGPSTDQMQCSEAQSVGHLQCIYRKCAGTLLLVPLFTPASARPNR